MTTALTTRLAPRHVERLRCVCSLWHCFRLGWREAWGDITLLAARSLTFALMITVWASLWHVVPADTLARFSLSYGQIVWYFVLAEIVAFSGGHAYRRIEDEVESGALTLRLVRPVRYVALTAAEELGHTAVKLAGFIAVGMPLAWGLTGTLPIGPATIVPLLAMLFAGAALYLALQILIGLAAAWVGSPRAVFFITQKIVFVLGGLIVPLTAYPAVLQRIAFVTPFPAMLYAPASLMLDGGTAHVTTMVETQAIWLSIALLALAGAGAAFERQVMREGLA